MYNMYADINIISTTIIHVCIYLYRLVSVMVTTRAMTVAGVNLAIMDQTVANHRFSLDGQLPPTLMRNGMSLLKFFKCYAHVILVTLLF